MRTDRRFPLLASKIKTVEQLKKITARLKSEGRRIVFTNGCFDILHYGHVKYLQDARRKGDALIVALNSDASVRRIKGDKRPLVNQKDRARIIASLASVDFVTLFNEDTPLKVIQALKPSILVKGADWKKNTIVGKDIVTRYGGKVTTITFVKNYSTTNLIRKIAETFSE